MKVLVIFVILISGYYVALTKTVMLQIKALENIYANAGTISSQVVSNKKSNQTAQDLQTLQKPAGIFIK